jgi:predicted transposase YdaD
VISSRSSIVFQVTCLDVEGGIVPGAEDSEEGRVRREQKEGRKEERNRGRKKGREEGGKKGFTPISGEDSSVERSTKVSAVEVNSVVNAFDSRQKNLDAINYHLFHSFERVE